MKKFIIALVAMFMMTFTSASAMSYEQARQQALFLTDKMAYELNLTDDQYEAAYEINLDYLMGVDTYDDLYGIYWRQRNLDLSYILLDWQYRSFCAASYFYRPLYWDGGYFHFGIYARYPRRDYFFFGRPHFYAVYRGGHSWRMNGGRSWYHGRELSVFEVRNQDSVCAMDSTVAIMVVARRSVTSIVRAVQELRLHVIILSATVAKIMLPLEVVSVAVVLSEVITEADSAVAQPTTAVRLIMVSLHVPALQAGGLSVETVAAIR